MIANLGSAHSGQHLSQEGRDVICSLPCGSRSLRGCQEAKDPQALEGMTRVACETDASSHPIGFTNSFARVPLTNSVTFRKFLNLSVPQQGFLIYKTWVVKVPT